MESAAKVYKVTIYRRVGMLHKSEFSGLSIYLFYLYFFFVLSFTRYIDFLYMVEKIKLPFYAAL